MSSPEQPLIHLSHVRRVFFTDEVETHALSGIHLDIKKGEYVSIAGPSARLADERIRQLGPIVAHIAEELTRHLGGRWPHPY